MSFDKCMYLSISNPFQNVEHYHHLRRFPHTLSSNPPSASLAADVLHHGRAGTSGWEYSGRTNSLGIQTVPTHRLLEEKNSELGKELTAKGGEMELGVLVTVEKFSIRKNIFY